MPFGIVDMKKQKNVKKVRIAAAVAFGLAAFAVVAYWFQHEAVDIGGYTVVYYKHRCSIDTQTLPTDFDSLKALPCLIRINWRERIASDMEQEYSYIPDRGIEKTRRIHKSSNK